jgi:GGDEF domain-containing protein
MEQPSLVRIRSSAAESRLTRRYVVADMDGSSEAERALNALCTPRDSALASFESFGGPFSSGGAPRAANLGGQFLPAHLKAIICNILSQESSLHLLSKSTLRSLLVPGGALLLGIMLLASLGWVTLAPPALSFLYYCAIGGGMLLAWRFHSSRIFLSLCVLLLAEAAIALWGGGQLPVILTAVRAVAVLVPLNFALISLMHERGFTLESLMPVGLFLFVEVIVVAVLCRTAENKLPSPAHTRHLAGSIALPDYAIVIFAGTAAFLLIRFMLTRKPVESALLWAMSAFFLSLHFTTDARLATLYSATAACILSTSIIESSYLLAYRAFNDAVLRLQEPYSIAVVDIDHFKKFNDTYGHDTGDQVLRLVASNLARVTGGGRAYRCGGEEFNILFPGKTIPEVLDHLERLRQSVESSRFRMRGDDRRQTARGPDRRNGQNRRRVSKGQVIRELAEQDSPASLSVTVSIGVASSLKKSSGPDAVLQAADKALYRAKANGRNRVETALLPRKARAAGIA